MRANLGDKNTDRRLLFIVSPAGVCIIAAIPLFISLLIPESIYVYYVREDFFIKESAVTAFYVSNVLVVWGAAYFTSRLCAGPPIDLASRTGSRFILYWGAFVTSTVLNLISFSSIIQNSPHLLSAIAVGDGALAKASVDPSGAFSQAQPLLLATSIYMLYFYLGNGCWLSASARLSSKLALAAAIVVSILVAVLKVARFELVPLFFMLLIVAAFWRAQRKVTSLPKIAFAAIGAFGFLLGIFSIFAVFRGSADTYLLIESILGYGPASFNHLGAFLRGNLILTYGGSGVYAAPFMSFIPLFEGLFHIRDLLGLPTIEDGFAAEFLDAQAAGLNASYIWITTFGYIYADVGYAVYIVSGAMGCVMGAAWSGFNRGRPVGIVMYPFVASKAMLFFSSNYFAKPELVTFLGLAVILQLGESILAGRGSPRQRAMRTRLNLRRSRRETRRPAPSPPRGFALARSPRTGSDHDAT